MNKDEMYDFLVETEIATKNEIDLVTCINGYRQEVLEDILYVRTGYRTFNQYIESEI